MLGIVGDGDEKPRRADDGQGAGSAPQSNQELRMTSVRRSFQSPSETQIERIIEPAVPSALPGLEQGISSLSYRIRSGAAPPPHSAPRPSSLKRRRNLNFEGRIDPLTPFTAVPFLKFKGYGQMPRSDKGLAVPVTDMSESTVVVFISHRWLRPWPTQEECEANGAVWAGAPHPDDVHGTKLSLIMQGVEALAENNHWALGNVAIWLDYSCISQDNTVLKGAGIRSLLGYAALCELVLIPCLEDPQFPVAHMVQGGYGERAWTRLEAFCFYVLSLLRGMPAPLLYYAAPSCHVNRLEYNILPDSMPSNGILFLESDRGAILNHERTLLDALHQKALREAAKIPQAVRKARVSKDSIHVEYVPGSPESQHFDDKTQCAGPALVAAAALGNLERVDELLAAGVSVNICDNRGYTALISAARYDRRLVVAALLKAQASVDQQTDDGWTPLIMCARKGHAETAKLLLDAGAAVNVQWQGKTPLMVAQMKNHPEVAQVIHEHCASRCKQASDDDEVRPPEPAEGGVAPDGS